MGPHRLPGRDEAVHLRAARDACGDRNSIEAPNAVMPPGVTPWGRFLSALLSATVIPWLKIPAASVDVIVPDDGMSLEPYGVSGRVLHTPGTRLGPSASCCRRVTRSSATWR